VNPATTLKLDISKLIDIFEKHAQSGGEPLVSIIACGILSDSLSLENPTPTATLIQARFSNQSTFTTL